jgi:hypothetical protein
MRLGCSSRFRNLSRNESDSRLLGSIAGAGWFPDALLSTPGSAGEGGERWTHGDGSCPPPSRVTFPPPAPPARGRGGGRWVRHPRPCPHPAPFREPDVGKSVKRKRDLFPGSRTASRGSHWCCHQLNAPWTTANGTTPPHRGEGGPGPGFYPQAQAPATPTGQSSTVGRGETSGPPIRLRNINRNPF